MNYDNNEIISIYKSIGSIVAKVDLLLSRKYGHSVNSKLNQSNFLWNILENDCKMNELIQHVIINDNCKSTIKNIIKQFNDIFKPHEKHLRKSYIIQDIHLSNLIFQKSTSQTANNEIWTLGFLDYSNSNYNFTIINLAYCISLSFQEHKNSNPFEISDSLITSYNQIYTLSQLEIDCKLITYF